MEYHPLTKKIIGLLEEKGLWFETFEHEEVRTSDEASKVRHGYGLHQGTKAMILRIKKSKSEKKFVMLVLPGDKRFDNTKVKKVLAAKDVRFATEEEIEKITEGVKVGGVPPFGNLFGMEVFADPSIFNNKKIIFNAGDRRFSVAIKSADYRSLVEPKIIDII